MKHLLLCLSISVAAATHISAQTYMTRTGKIYFDASSKSSPEKIEAKNNEVASILDQKTGDLRFQVLVSSFKFERELMQEHFNENYMETEKFPKSDFKGTITNINDINFAKDGTYNANVTGKLTMHGVTNDLATQGSVTVKGGSVMLKAKFQVKLQDYKIAIPSMVADKVDKIATISLESDLTKK